MHQARYSIPGFCSTLLDNDIGQRLEKRAGLANGTYPWSAKIGYVLFGEFVEGNLPNCSQYVSPTVQ